MYDQPRNPAPPLTGIRDNHRHGRAGDFLAETVHPGARLSVVSAYFTIYAYDALKAALDGIEHLDFLFGEPRFLSALDPEGADSKAFLLDESGLALARRLAQKRIARECADWIRRKVDIRSVRHGRLLHGKLYHIANGPVEEALIGSSNFTVAGLGLGSGANLELNLVVDSARDRRDLKAWFDELWNDSSLVADVKDEVLRRLDKLHANQSPQFIYYLTLFHLFRDFLDGARDLDENLRRVAIPDTRIWQALFSFQKDGAKAAINKILNYHGCILADSVGLGKTYTALAVIKYFELRNERVLVLCPKKLTRNWTIYRQPSSLNPFADDRFRFDVLHHTDLSRDSGEVNGLDLASLNWGAYDLVVIDESHNFRNNKLATQRPGQPARRSRYQRLMDDIIAAGVRTKVLLLSATPVNNQLADLRNQFSFIAGGDVARDDQADAAFAQSLNIPSVRDTTRLLAAWDPYDQNASADFFDPEWMFGVTEGFDIAIGNPPYVRIQTLTQSDAAQTTWLKEHYAAAAKGNYDLYVVFVERGLQLLNSRGQLAYILPHKFFNAQYGQPLRELLARGRHLRHVVHFGDQQIFPGATNYVCLLFLAKAGAETCRWVRADDLPAWLATQRAPETILPAARLTAAEWNFAVGPASRLFDKLQAMPVKLGDLAERISQGIRTSANEVYVLDVVSERGGLITARSKQLEREVVLERKAVSRFLAGREIKAYSIQPSGKVVIIPYELRGENSVLISIGEFATRFPKAAAYLQANKEYLEDRENGRMRGAGWHGFIYPKNLEVMVSPKLLVPDIADRAAFAFDEKGEFAFTSGYGITFKHHVKESPKYLLGLLNSRLLDWFWKRVSTPLRGGFYRHFSQFIAQLPIRPIDFGAASERAEHDALVGLVERILAAKRANPAADTTAPEREIDERVYRLYGLTLDEIKIVEEGTK